MNQIFKNTLTIANSSSIIGFENVGGGSWPRWDRYLTIDGKHAYHMGNICGTCIFFFERLDGANKGVVADDLIKAFSDGMQDLDESLINTASRILPTGTYWPSLLNLFPVMVKPGAQNDYFVNEQADLWGISSHNIYSKYPPYYRSQTIKMEKEKHFFEFMIPMYSDDMLNREDIQKYTLLLNEGNQPTAFAISVLDVKETGDWDENVGVPQHYCLAHYLLDGHHKTFAASQLNKPITLLSFLAVDECIASDEQIQEVFDLLKG